MRCKKDLCGLTVKSCECTDSFRLCDRALLFLQVPCLVPSIHSCSCKPWVDALFSTLVFPCCSVFGPGLLFMAHYSNPTEEVCQFLTNLFCLSVSGLRVWQMIWEALPLLYRRRVKTRGQRILRISQPHRWDVSIPRRISRIEIRLPFAERVH